MLLTDDDKKLEYEPRYDERPAVAPDPVERQCVDGDAARAERQHHAQDHRGQSVAVLISYRIIIIGKLVETVGRGGHPVPDGGQDGGQQMDEDQEDANQSDEGVQRAAALAHGKIHHSSNQESQEHFGNQSHNKRVFCLNSTADLDCCSCMERQSDFSGKEC